MTDPKRWAGESHDEWLDRLIGFYFEEDKQ